MNNINCEHCGTQIDVEKETRCPNCGAPYKNNKQYKEYKAYQKRQKELVLETHQIANDIAKDTHNVAKKMVPGIFIFVLIVFIFIGTIFFIIFYNIFSQIEETTNSNTDYKDNYNQIIDDNFFDDLGTKKLNDEEITVNFEEYAITSEYDIMVDKITKYTEKHFANNKKYYGFRIVFNNKTSRWKTLNDIHLTYVSSKGTTLSATKPTVSTIELDYFASNVQVYNGFIYFDIPDEIKDVRIIYENVIIELPNFRNKIK